MTFYRLRIEIRVVLLGALVKMGWSPLPCTMDSCIYDCKYSAFKHLEVYDWHNTLLYEHLWKPFYAEQFKI